MTVIFCVDDHMGLAFHNRRLSRDRELCRRLLERSAGHTLRMSAYSRPLFEPLLPEFPTARVAAAEGDLTDASGDDLCFLEQTDPLPWLERADRLVLVRWNRVYPSDRKFPAEDLEVRWQLTGTAEFPGSSHDRLTEERYEKK